MFLSLSIFFLVAITGPRESAFAQQSSPKIAQEGDFAVIDGIRYAVDQLKSADLQKLASDTQDSMRRVGFKLAFQSCPMAIRLSSEVGGFTVEGIVCSFDNGYGAVQLIFCTNDSTGTASIKLLPAQKIFSTEVTQFVSRNCIGG